MLFRKGDALQRLSAVRVVAFDKTGTLTQGRPVLTDLVPAPGFARAEVLRAMATAEARSEHPIARAVVTAAEDEGVGTGVLTDFEAVAGFGIRAVVDGADLWVGTDRRVAEAGIDISDFAEAVARLAGEGKTPLYVALGGRLAALAAVADAVRPSARAAVSRLREAGIAVAMVTGDRQATAQAIAGQLGIDVVVAQVPPGGKVAAVEDLRRAHGAVAFVGDGINDAPALAAADVGLAVATGTDIAVEAADVVLTSPELTVAPDAIALSRATLANIRQNLVWAFGYNALLIPVAAGVLYPFGGILLSPILAAGAMMLSSLFVVGNALRLRRFRRSS
jgi:P-type E1-E2 ATPase